MKLNAYSIYDRKALQYHAPFFTHTDGSALRAFSDLANDMQTNIGRHPGDYVLYRVGQYEDSSAVLLGHEPAHVADALSLLHTEVKAPLFDIPAGLKFTDLAPAKNGAK